MLLKQVLSIISLGKIPKELVHLWVMLLVIYRINLIRLEMKLEKHTEHLARVLMIKLREIYSSLTELGIRYYLWLIRMNYRKLEVSICPL